MFLRCEGHVKSGTVVPKLRHAIGAEGLALLDRFNLLQPLLERMVTSEAIAAVAVSEEQLEQGRLGLLRKSGFAGIEEWAKLLETLGRS